MPVTSAAAPVSTVATSVPSPIAPASASAVVAKVPCTSFAIARASRLAVVAAHHLARHPAHRLEQRLPVVGERRGHLAQHALLMLRQPAAVHEPVHVLPDLEVALDDPVDDPADLRLELLGRVADDLPLERAA